MDNYTTRKSLLSALYAHKNLAFRGLEGDKERRYVLDIIERRYNKGETNMMIFTSNKG